jgi:hypothetical protein
VLIFAGRPKESLAALQSYFTPILPGVNMTAHARFFAPGKIGAPRILGPVRLRGVVTATA